MFPSIGILKGLTVGMLLSIPAYSISRIAYNWSYYKNEQYLSDDEEIVIKAKKMAKEMGINPDRLKLSEDNEGITGSSLVYFNPYTWSYVVKITPMFLNGKATSYKMNSDNSVVVNTNKNKQLYIDMPPGTNKKDYEKIISLSVTDDFTEYVIAHELSHIYRPLELVKYSFYRKLGNLTQSQKISELLKQNELACDTLAVTKFPYLLDKGVYCENAQLKKDKIYGYDPGLASFTHPSSKDRLINLLKIKILTTGCTENPYK